MGFIFWPKSSRYVSLHPAYLPNRCKRVGVFVDADIAEVAGKTEEYQLDLIQLHGNEQPDYISRLQSLCRKPDLSIIKAFNIATVKDLQLTLTYEGIADYFLFDTKAKMVGGNGTQFDWSVLNAYEGRTPFFLSGGIGPEDVGKLKTFCHPMLAGIDLNSRFEEKPGLKNITLLETFLQEIEQTKNNYE